MQIYAPNSVQSHIQQINKSTKPDYIGGLDWAGVKKYWSEGDLNAALIYGYNPRKDHVDSVKKQMKTIHEKGFWRVFCLATGPEKSL